MNNNFKDKDSKQPDNEEEKPRPIKALLVGFALSNIAQTLTSTLVGMTFILSMHIAVDSSATMKTLAANNQFLISDAIVSALVLLASGFISSKYVPSYEIRHGVVLGTINTVFLAWMYIVNDTGSATPVWYDALVFVCSFFVIILGCNLRILHDKNRHAES